VPVTRKLAEHIATAPRHLRREWAAIDRQRDIVARRADASANEALREQVSDWKWYAGLGLLAAGLCASWVVMIWAALP
jgi:hypothetical protein